MINKKKRERVKKDDFIKNL